MSHRNDGPRGGLTYRQAAAAAILWALTAGVCHQLGGCGTIEGVGRDLQASSRMVSGWWEARQGERPVGSGQVASGEGKKGGGR